MVIEQAKKELEKLENQYPDSFQSLKLDLKTFITQLEEDQKLSSRQSYSIPTTTASTHVSSTRKKRKKDNRDVEEMKDDDDFEESDEAESKLEVSKRFNMKRSCGDFGYYGKRRDMSSLAAIERARVCLQKVQQFKTTFFHY